MSPRQPRKPKQIGSGRPKKPKGARGRAIPKKVKIPKYEMPKNIREFRLDVEIGMWYLGLPDALSKERIIKRFGITEKKLNERARVIAPLLEAGERKEIIEALLEMGREKAAGKR